MDNEIKKKAKLFLKEYGLQNVTLENLRSAIQKQGYTIVEYNNIFNDGNIAALINALGPVSYTHLILCIRKSRVKIFFIGLTVFANKPNYPQENHTPFSQRFIQKQIPLVWLPVPFYAACTCGRFRFCGLFVHALLDQPAFVLPVPASAVLLRYLPP